MTTSDEGDLGNAPAIDLSREIERVANQLFGGRIPELAPRPPGSSAPQAGEHALPNALSLGAGGVSSALTAPPIPGPLHRPPLAATPPPKESDLRTLPAMFAEPLGTTPIALVRELSLPSSSESTPYFLGLAGLPGAAPTLPGSVPTQGPTASSAPGAPGAPGFPGVPMGSPALPLAEGAPRSALPDAGVDAPVGAEPTPFVTSYEFQPELVPDVSASRGAFDAASVKRDFPILQERVHGRPLIWLDSAATTQKPQAVIDRVSYFYEHENSNVHRAAHALAARATDAYEAARDKVRRFLGAPSAKEIVFVRGATEAINLVAQSWGRRNVQAGDEIVITWLEHHANIVPWQQLCSEKGARLRVAPVDSRGQVNLEEYEKLLGPKTRLVSITQVSNALGTVVPVQAMTETAHRYGAKVHIDGAQAVSHMPVDVQALGCDFYSFSGHKVFGPTGIGVLFGRAEILEAMPPWQGGGNMIADVTFEKTAYQSAPARFEAGTGNIADAVGLGAALDYVSALGMENVRRYEHELLEYAEAGLARVPGLHLIGTAAEKAGVMSFVLDGIRTEDVGAALDQEGIALRSGHHCAQPILRRFGLESTVRASLAVYNTKDDLDALVAALLRLRAGQPLTRG